MVKKKRLCSRSRKNNNNQEKKKECLIGRIDKRQELLKVVESKIY